MTTKELISFTGKTERTIRRWIEKSNIVGCDKMSYQVERDYTIDEVEKILNAGSISKDAVNILMQNARQSQQIELAEQGLNNINMQMFADMMAVSMATALKPLYDRLDNLENKKTEQLALPQVPQEEPRAYLNRLVREYAQLKDIEFRKAWNILYTEILYRCHENIKVKAKNEGVKPVDYLERENKLLTACSIMRSLINGN